MKLINLYVDWMQKVLVSLHYVPLSVGTTVRAGFYWKMNIAYNETTHSHNIQIHKHTHTHTLHIITLKQSMFAVIDVMCLQGERITNQRISEQTECNFEMGYLSSRKIIVCVGRK